MSIEKDRTPEAYSKALDEACKIAGSGGWYWNERFVSALGRRGLTLAEKRHPLDRDEWYPSGHPMESPEPYPNTPMAWPEGALVVWRQLRVRPT